MEKIDLDDLSFQKLSEQITNDKIGGDYLYAIALEMEQAKTAIANHELSLSRAKARKQTLLEYTTEIRKLLCRNAPLAILRENQLVVVTERDITIEPNVI